MCIYAYNVILIMHTYDICMTRFEVNSLLFILNIYMTLDKFCSVAIIFLNAVAKIKFAKISNIAEVKELAASNWISTTCRDIQTAIIKTCAYNNRFALKCAFGESYNDLYPGTIYSPPSL